MPQPVQYKDLESSSIIDVRAVDMSLVHAFLSNAYFAGPDSLPWRRGLDQNTIRQRANLRPQVHIVVRTTLLLDARCPR